MVTIVFAEAVQAYRVVSLDRPAGATAAAFVGRAPDLTDVAPEAPSL